VRKRTSIAVPNCKGCFRQRRTKTGQGEKTMNRTTLAAITLVSALATPVVVNATAQKASPAGVRLVRIAHEGWSSSVLSFFRVCQR
jgi:hypothetical protein